MSEAAENNDNTKRPDIFLHTVEVDVSDEETTARTLRLVEVDRKINETEADKASRVSDFNGELKQLRKERNKLLDAITNRKEKRDVECYEQPDERRNIVFIVRASDGKVLDERAMTLEDRQTPLPFKQKTPEQQEADAASEAAEAGDAQPEKAKPKATKVVRIKTSDAKKRKEAKAAAEKARAMADEHESGSDDDGGEESA